MDNLVYSMIDCTYPVPGPLQHSIIRTFALENGFSVGFYGAEDPEFREDSPYLRGKIARLHSKYQGVIFFSVFQLRGDVEKLVRTLLGHDLIVMFAVQRLFFPNTSHFKSDLILFKAALTSVLNRHNGDNLYEKLASISYKS